MVKDALVDLYVNKGREFLQLLDGAGIDVTGALWLKDGESESWTLLLAVPRLDSEKDPRNVYGDLLAVFRKHEEALSPLVADDFMAKSPKERPFRDLRLILRTPPKALTNTRFTGNRVNDYLIEDALIYRMS